MKKEILIVLARSSGCPYCEDFKPIYELSKQTYNKNKFLSSYGEIKFDDYDFIDDVSRGLFITSHGKIKNDIKWYPTIFVNIRDIDSNGNKTNEYYTIEPTRIDPEIKNKNSQLNDAVDRFLENIVNCLKTIESDNKINYVQTKQIGGNNYELGNNYKSKYLKYKTKYLELKAKKF